MNFKKIIKAIFKTIKYTLIAYIAWIVGVSIFLVVITRKHSADEYIKVESINLLYSPIVNRQFETIVETCLLQYKGSDNWHLNNADHFLNRHDIHKNLIKLEKGLKFRVVKAFKTRPKTGGDLSGSPYVVAEITIDQTVIHADAKELFKGSGAYDKFPIEPNPNFIIEITEDTNN